MAKKKKEEQLNFKETKRELQELGPKPLYFLWGAEDYLSDYFVKEIKNACIPDGFDDFSYRRINAGDFSTQLLAEAVDAVPFMTERTMVEVRDLNLNQLRDEEAEAVIKVLKDIPEYCTVVFIQSASFEPDKRLKFYKSFLNIAHELHFTAQRDDQLIKWIVKRFSAAGKSIELNAAQRLIAVSGDLMNNLIPEINKVAAYAKGEKVSIQDVEDVAHHIPEAVVFDMTECLSRGESNAAMAYLAELLGDKNNEPIYLLAMIGMQMRRLYAAKIAIDTEDAKEYLRKNCGIKYEFIATKLIVAARKFSEENLARAVELCAETDYKMKSSGEDPVELLKDCVLRIASGERDA